MNKREIIKQAVSIEGLVEPNELELLYDLAERYITDEGSVLEIGCYLGKTSYIFAKLIDRVLTKGNTGRLCVVDVFDKGQGEQRPEYKLHTKEALLANLGDLGNHVSIWEGESLDVQNMNEILNHRFDLVFLDGDHRRPVVLAELGMAKYVTDHIIGHDYNNADVKDSVNKFVQYHKFQLEVYNTQHGLWEIKCAEH